MRRLLQDGSEEKRGRYGRRRIVAHSRTLGQHGFLTLLRPLYALTSQPGRDIVTADVASLNSQAG